MPRNPDHRGATREEFERYQRERPIMLRRFATILQVWRWCDRKECRRAKACTGPADFACTTHFIQDILSEEERATFHEWMKLRLSGLGVEEAWAEATRRITRHKAQMDAIDEMRPGG
ncbi:hypothetical protein [Bosea sp. (in: a-proteobacteria)]|jgi:hypothetical protein|uniref:hypothetical protein n=1 Tax=Bosea sp. (in: a-proteobacteria) TaxID=1871050 RepID=UPI003F724B14